MDPKSIKNNGDISWGRVGCAYDTFLELMIRLAAPVESLRWSLSAADKNG